MSHIFNHLHLLGVYHLEPADITHILDVAGRYGRQNRSACKSCDLLAGKTIVNMFFEDSTRTRMSFEIAAKRLGAHVVNFTARVSSINKGETYADTLRTLNAMQVDALVIRHAQDGAIDEAAQHVDCSVLNAGDGAGEHPTQALLDARTLLNHKERLDGLKVAICGDLKHSRVARSNAILLKKMGAQVFFFAPPQFAMEDAGTLGAKICTSMAEAIEDADAVMMLRIQNERLQSGEMTMSGKDYHAAYGLNHDRLAKAKPDVVVMHPAPMNRGVEISDALADDPRYSVIFEQMEMGVAVRMACLDLLLNRSSS